VRPFDAAIFWNAGQSVHYYGAVWTQQAGYVYPPVLAQLAGLLAWQSYLVVWMTLIFACLWVALRWLALPALMVGALAFAVMGAGPLSSVLALATVGNPQAVVAALVVVGLRAPAAWAPVLLTKIGPGIGVAWFAFRGEWRHAGVALLATAAIAGVSFALAPGAWGDFVRFALNNYAAPSPVPLVPVPVAFRLPMAVALIWWGARANRAWTVPVASGWAALALYEWSYLTIWLAALPVAVPSRFLMRVGPTRGETGSHDV
jgi:hypothetical protein